MAATHGGCGQSPSVIGRPVDRVFEDAQFTGEVNLNGRKLRDYPNICTKYDLADTIHTDLSKNRLVELPAGVCEYRSMERLNCYHNVIKSIPVAIGQLQALTHLNLCRNQLTALPVAVCSLSSLEVLLISNNKLASLPEDIGKLDRLMDLDVSCNEISELPPQIGDLRSLRSLNLRRNLLIELPLDICKLNLLRLEISSNRIQKIPTVFHKLEVLEQIILEHNPLECPPAHLCTRGRQHIMKFLHIEAIKEDRKRGFLSEADMKRLLRKSLPTQPPSDEFRNILEGPEGKWKRHTVLSSDSGYSTADSLDRSGFNQTELEGMGGEVDENVLAIKAAEAVREQRQGHNNSSCTNTSSSSRLYTKSSSSPLPNGKHSSCQQQQLLANGSKASFGSNPDVSALPQELQLQKDEYELKKKEAEQIRLGLEEKECEERRRTSNKRQEEPRSTGLDQQRGDMQRRKLKRRQQDDKQRQDADIQCLAEEQPQKKVSQQQQRFTDLHQTTKTDGERRLREEEMKTEEDNRRGDHIKQQGDGLKNKIVKNTGNASGTNKDQVKRTGNAQYRRTTSDTTPRRGIPTAIGSHRNVEAHNYTNKGGGGEESDISNKPAALSPGTGQLQNVGDLSSPVQIPVARRSKGADRSHVPTPMSGRTTTKLSNAVNNLQSPDDSGRGLFSASPSSCTNAVRNKNNSTPTSTPKNTRRAGGRTSRMYTEPASTFSRLRPSSAGDQNDEEGPPKSLQSKSRLEDQRLKGSASSLSSKEEDQPPSKQTRTQAESQRSKSRLEDPRSKAGASSSASKRSGVSDADTRRSGPGTRSGLTATGKMQRSDQQSRLHLSNGRPSGLPCKQTTGSGRSQDDYKDGGRRRGENNCEETQQMELLRQMIESRLNVPLPDNLGEALKDGVVLCHLANHVRPRSVATIHVPSPAVPKVTAAKCRRNIESFLDACRKIGIDQEHICLPGDIIDERSLQRVAVTVTALLGVGSGP